MIAGRGIDHLVLCVRDLNAAQAYYRRLGFTLTPRAAHPWGTANHLVQLQGNFLEILAVVEPAKIAPPQAGVFGFGAFNQRFLARREGMSMLVFQSRDARADQAAFRAAGLDTYPPFDFERRARLPDGSEAPVAFSLAFVTHKEMPEAAFFTCQQHSPQHFWKPEYQTHANGALRVDEVVMRAPEPARFVPFFAKLQGADAISSGDGRLDVRTASGRIVLLDDARIAERFPEMQLPVPKDSPVFAGYRIAVADIGICGKILRDGSATISRHRGALLTQPQESFGAAIEFAQA